MDSKITYSVSDESRKAQPMVCQLVSLDIGYQKPFPRELKAVHYAAGPESASSFRFKNLTGPHPTVNQKLMYFHNLSPLHSRFREDAGGFNVPGKQLGLDING